MTQTSTKKGNISVNTENIFPLIKKSLYSNQEIFLRELVSNGVDACQKLTALAAMGEVQGEIGEMQVQVRLDKEAKTITISDNGLGLTEEEIEKYITQVAFSGATEFIEK
ncbi:MAG: ATP-binding protein, partial [Bacteroidota bacterium]